MPQAARSKIAQTLAPFAERFKVGVVWSSSVTFEGNRDRATGLDRFLDLAEVPGVQLVSLQKGLPEAELEGAGARGPVSDLAPLLNSFADTAAVCQQLDLVVMTDSAVTHLAGSLGPPVWNLLNHLPYWLYLGEGSQTAWYPSMRLFRQSAPGDWDSVFRQVEAARAAAVAGKPRPSPKLSTSSSA